MLHRALAPRSKLISTCKVSLRVVARHSCPLFADCGTDTPRLYTLELQETI